MANRFDTEAQSWDLNPTTHMLSQAIEQHIHTQIQFDTTWQVLDYGSGTGNLLMHIVPLVAHITAMDNSQGMLEVLRNKIPAQFQSRVTTLLHNADNDTLPHNAYDLIVSSMTLHHIRNTQLFLSQCYAALKPQGTICFVDLLQENGTFHKEIDDTIHHFGFDISALETIMQSIGYSQISIQPFYSIYKEHVNASFPVFMSIGRKDC